MNIFRFAAAVASTIAVLTVAPIHPPAAAPSTATSTTSTPRQTHTPITPQSQQWSVQVDTPTLTQYMNSWAAAQGTIQTPLGDARLKQLSADIRDNKLIVSGTAESGWLTVPVDAAAAASAQNGAVQVHIEQAHINGVDMPDVLRSQLEQQLQNQLAQSLAAYRVTVQSVQLGDGKLVVAGARF
jgi:hypothetical protein